MPVQRDGFKFRDALLAELEAARARHQTRTYRQMIDRLALPSPAMRTLTAALEALAQEDVEAGRPVRAALVVSQAGSGLPRPGFFECLAALGACPAELDEAGMHAWHAAELRRVFATENPDI